MTLNDYPSITHDLGITAKCPIVGRVSCIALCINIVTHCRVAYYIHCTVGYHWVCIKNLWSCQILVLSTWLVHNMSNYLFVICKGSQDFINKYLGVLIHDFKKSLQDLNACTNIIYKQYSMYRKLLTLKWKAGVSIFLFLCHPVAVLASRSPSPSHEWRRLKNAQ